MLKPVIVFWLSILWYNLFAQSAVNQVYVDDNGVMRWSADKRELHGFGVNYTLPFAHEYRMVANAGISHEEAIKQDVYHMARLDLDLYRVHIWDTEISDTLGNLIDNEHLRLFDFAVSEMKKRGMHFIITPIAYWGNGWPEPDEATPGFSRKYGKAACLTHPEALKAQANYLAQFLNHVNTYTGNAYKDEPQVIAFEISNEPHHNGPADEVTRFINTLVSSMRNTGYTRPIFYNMSHSIHLADAYLNADIQGGTFQWYPTGLVAGHQVNGNFLPHVSDYSIPFANDSRYGKMAKIVYEFDPADASGNVMYPAMARTFREAGMQLAAQFAYDAMCWAPFNTNYGTHFMNLAYAPNKAISLKIAAAIFHQVPMYQKHANKDHFNGFQISYADDLAAWVSDEKFFYSNNTTSQPANISLLTEIAGCGSSPLVKYTGSGAYFIDKLSNGVWRLEVMPDFCWIEDPYSSVNPAKQKAAVLHNRQHMTITLPDLGNGFIIQGINQGNTFNGKASKSSFEVMPGTYLLTKSTTDAGAYTGKTYKNITIDEYVAPASNLGATILHNLSPDEATAGKPVALQFEVNAPLQINKVEVLLTHGEKNKTVTAVKKSTNRYTAEIPADFATIGFLNYQVMVSDDLEITTFPAGCKGSPWSWENRDMKAYQLRLVTEKSPLTLWEAANDWDFSNRVWNRDIKLMPAVDGETVLLVKQGAHAAANQTGNTIEGYAFKFFFGHKTAGRMQEFSQKQTLAIKAKNLLTLDQEMEIGLVDYHGVAVSGQVVITPGEQIFRIPLNSLKPAPVMILPRPYPDFLPREVPAQREALDWSSLEMIQVHLKPGEQKRIHLEIDKIWLE